MTLGDNVGPVRDSDHLRVGGAPDVHKPVRVTVGVLTYKRPADVQEMLPLLLEQAVALLSQGEYSVEILVVDNDSAGSAASLAAPYVAMPGQLLRYVVEEVPGIAAARNRALDEASGSRILVFIDDDERPDPVWLRELLAMWARSGAAVIAGRVLEEFAQPPESWLVSGGFFRRPARRTGSERMACGAGNMLLDLDQVRETGVRFDLSFGLSGGEDTLFCRQLTGSGLRIVECDEARVTDIVPSERINRRWVLKRSFSHGNTTARVELALAHTSSSVLGTRIKMAVNGLVRLAGGSSRYLVGAVSRSERHRARGLRTAYRGAGMMAGSSGLVHQEYRRSE